MSEQEAEDKRAQQLEEARKRVEELKKKKKNKKNKNKKNKAKEKEDENETVDVDTNEDLTPAPEVSINQDVPEAEAEDDAVATKEQENEDTSLKPEEEEVTAVQETEADETESAVKSEKITGEEKIDETVSNVENISTGQKEEENLFDSNNTEPSDFLKTIQQEKKKDKINQLNQKLEELTIENKRLKFTNIEQDTDIEELEAEIAKLKQSLQAKDAELERTKDELKEALEERKSRPEANPFQFASFNDGSSGMNSHDGFIDTTRGAGRSTQIQTPKVDRVLLNKWRNWNVDMTSWRSIGSGPIVEF
ncbi:Bug1p NDAI_0B03210 [Naumovozyma dairenensis CBS 421]|uniref:Binder of USO1 and GRH1 protein 1 n=1 Tax=Naumovozyma dairenensis (strain ATCC 10597 / BCRC 20456 / CBS 421 / NBRC 0211 / NRRL Y-12639) TaxID=1071378 RepID=G0W6E5_NAUDC|nr:hypothetical protein NDAI_0B03210 [Naumovozyma dairenensis CBS 421]CCD23356.1 hypothetical protein NDAI_0B03210 [Naumovozyma dairenensis CBS 421]